MMTPAFEAAVAMAQMRNQRNLLAEALGKVLVHYGVVRPDAELTGPELLLAAETALKGD